MAQAHRKLASSKTALVIGPGPTMQLKTPLTRGWGWRNSWRILPVAVNQHVIAWSNCLQNGPKIHLLSIRPCQAAPGVESSRASWYRVAMQTNIVALRKNKLGRRKQEYECSAVDEAELAPTRPSLSPLHFISPQRPSQGWSGQYNGLDVIRWALNRTIMFMWPAQLPAVDECAVISEHRSTFTACGMQWR